MINAKALNIIIITFPSLESEKDHHSWYIRRKMFNVYSTKYNNKLGICIEMINYLFIYYYYGFVFRSRNLVDGKFRFVSKMQKKKWICVLNTFRCCYHCLLSIVVCLSLLLVFFLLLSRSKTGKVSFSETETETIHVNVHYFYSFRWVFLMVDHFCWKSIFHHLFSFHFVNYNSRIADPSQRENLGIIVQYKVKVKLCIGGPILGG